MLRYAKAFLDGGKAADGSTWLEQGTVAAMLEPQVEVPDPYTLGRHWGLGWILFEYGGRRVFGHDGGTLGQAAFLRVIPDRRAAVALLTTGGGASDLSQAFLTYVYAELADIELPPRPEPVPGASGGDRGRQVGRYVRAAATTEIEE